MTEAQAEALNERAEGWAAGLVSRGALAGRRQLVSRVVRRRRPLRHGLPASRGAQPRRAGAARVPAPDRPCSSRCAPRSATRCSSATTRRRCSSSWSARTCSSSPSTTSAAGSATTTCSGRCSRPSSSDASPSSLPLSIAERPRGARRTASRRWRSSTRSRPATPMRSPSSSARSRDRTTAAAV